MKRGSKEEKRHYKLHESLWTTECWYCGLVGYRIDHYPPISRAEYLIQVKGIQGWLVRSCDRCNLILSNSTQSNLDFRRAAVRSRIEYDIQIMEHFANGGGMEYLLHFLDVSKSRLEKLKKKAADGA